MPKRPQPPPPCLGVSVRALRVAPDDWISRRHGVTENRLPGLGSGNSKSPPPRLGVSVRALSVAPDKWISRRHGVTENHPTGFGSGNSTSSPPCLGASVRVLADASVRSAGHAATDAQQNVAPERLIGGLDRQHVIIRLDRLVEVPFHDRSQRLVGGIFLQ
jgi:hypothetical protein